MARRPPLETAVARINESLEYGYTGATTKDVYPVNLTVNSRSFSGTVTANFKRVKRLPFNPFSMVKVTITPGLDLQEEFTMYDNLAHPSIAGKTYMRKSVKVWTNGQDFSPVSGHIAAAESACSTKLQSKFSAVKVNLLQFFGERQQFINMVGNNARKIVQALHSLKRLHLGDAMRALDLKPPSKKFEDDFWLKHTSNAQKFPKRHRPEKITSSAWLELQYGWLPLLSDVEAASALLGDNIRKDEFTNTVKVRGKSTKKGDWNYFQFRGIYPNGSIPKSGDFVCQSTCKYIVTFVATNELKTAFAVTGISNPLLVAWELVPFSFVVDWFLPVGNFIEQLTAYDGFALGKVHRVRFTKGSIDTRYTGRTPVTRGYGYVFSGTAISVVGSYIRVEYSRDVIATPAFVPLEFKSPVSPIHAANSLALLAQFFGRK